MKTDEGIIWSTKVDKRYQVEVIRTGAYTADLVVTDDGRELLREKVSLAYKAIFGPDVDDIATWQERVIRLIDQELPK